jgi:DNA-binding CsgD family transcriptional regulator
VRNDHQASGGDNYVPRVRDISFIRKLCGLGLPAQTVAQCLLPELRKLIPSHSAGVFWVDPQCEMTSLYAERMLPPDAMAAYYERHYTVRTESFSDVFRRRAENADPVSFHSFSVAEQNSDYFRDVMRRLDAYHVLYGVLKEGARPFAQISFYRGLADHPFDRDNADTLRALLRYLATGLGVSDSPSRSGDAAVVVEEDLGIVGLTGALINAPEQWHRLLRLAALAEVSPRHAQKEEQVIESFVQRTCEELLSEQRTAPRELIHETAWGRFVIRGFRLTDPKGRRADQVGLLIRREEPRSLSLVRGTGVAALSPQQREVALLIVAGKSNREIAEDLGLSFNTASSHVKQVYARLDVNERSAVARKLLHLAQSAMAH